MSRVFCALGHIFGTHLYATELASCKLKDTSHSAFLFLPLLNTSIPSNGTNIHHPVPKLNERAPLYRNIQIRNIMQDKPHHFLILVLADPFYERVRGKRETRFVGRESVFGEAEIEKAGYWNGGGAELFLLLIEGNSLVWGLFGEGGKERTG